MFDDIIEKLDTPLEELDLSIRTCNCLRRAGMNTVFDVLKSTLASLIKVRNLGRKSLAELQQKLRELGFDPELQLMASNICAAAESYASIISMNNNPTFLKIILNLLACEDIYTNEDEIDDFYREYLRKKADLPLEDSLKQFVLVYYCLQRKQKEAPDTPVYGSDKTICYELNNDSTYWESMDEDAETEAISAQPSALSALEKMTGLGRVKEMVKDISAHCVIAKMKQEAGGINQIFIPNALFLGNPGTGKTTVAKIIAQLYKEIGLLKLGHLVVTEQSELIGKYMGQTAPKVKDLFESALGGVLFIDEAYMLGENYGYGDQAVATLTNMMTEHSGECCVILAGYEERMNRMMRETNPGLKERFPFKLVFEDYDKDELTDIFMGKLEQAKLCISKMGQNVVFQTIGELYEKRGEGFANAREVENLIQEIILQQERRLFCLREQGGTLSPRMLFSVTKADCLSAYERIKERANQPTQQKRLIGFMG